MNIIFQAKGEIVFCFRHLTKDNTLQLYIIEKASNASNNHPANDEPVYNLYVFDIRYNQEFASSQPIKAKSKCHRLFEQQ